MPNATAKPLEIARPGTFTAFNGRRFKLTEGDLKAMAAAYDPAVRRAPMVLGHPRLDAPAVGWVKSLRYEGGKLVAEPDQVEAAFAAAVNDGRYGTVSAALLEPSQSINPKQGNYYLRHVGFLGAMIPGIDSLKPPEFAAGEEYLEFAAGGMSMLGRMAAMGQRIAGMMRRRREAVIEKDGMEAADKEVPAWDLDMLEEDCRDMAKEVDDAGPGFAAPADVPAPVAGADLAARLQALEARECAITAREAALESQAAESRRVEFAAYVDGLVADGKVLPPYQPGLVAILAGEAGAEFAAGQDRFESHAQFITTFLDRHLTRQWTPGEVAKPEPEAPAGATFAAPPGYTVSAEWLDVHENALRYQAAHPGTSYLDAVRAVGGR
jgi:hypothetical protein